MDKTLRVLILEDNPADAELVQFELQEAGIAFTPKVVMKEKEFIHELRNFSPDIILSDYDLPRYSGPMALAEAKRQCPDIPFILVTGAVSEERAIEILTSGARDYVMKNRLARLEPAVRRALAEAEEHRARKQAEEELRRAHGELEEQVKKRTAELQAILDAAPIAIWLAHDPECRQITGNAYADDMIMQTPRGSNVSAGAAPGEAAVAYKVFRDGVELKPEELPAQIAVATGKPAANAALELIFSDGRHVHLLEGAVPLFDDAGRVRGAIATAADLTPIKEAETALRKSEERYRVLFEGMSEGFYLGEIIRGDDGKPQDYVYLDVNPAFEKIMGLERGQIIGKRLKELTPDVSSHWVETFTRVAMTGESVCSEFYSHTFRRHFKAMAFRPFERHFAVLLEDITERKRAEEALREAHAGTEAVLAGIADAFFSVDDAFRFVVVNPTAEQALFRQPADELLGKVIWDIFPNLVGTPIQQHYFDAVEKRGMEHYEAQSPLNGRWYEAFLSPRKGRLDVYLRDIDNRRKAEEAMKTALQRLSILVSSMRGGILLLGEERVELANQTFCDYFALRESPEDLIGLSPPELIEKIRNAYLDPDAAANRIQEIVREGQPVVGEEVALRNGGWCLRDFIPMFVDGKLSGRLWYHVDITERKRTEREITHLASFPLLNPNPVIEIDLAGAIHFMNPIAERLFPDLRKQGMAHPWFADWKHIVPEIVPEKVKLYEAEIKVDDRWYSQTIHFVEDTGRIRIYGRSVSKRKQAEAALRESEAKANALIKYAPTGIYEIDYRGPTFRSVNDAMCRILGYTRDELFALGPAGLLDNDSRAAFADRIRRQFAGEAIEEAVLYRVRKKDGSFIDALLNISINPEGSEPWCVLVVAHDVTNIKRVEEELRKSRNRYRLLFDHMQEGFYLAEIIRGEDGRPQDYLYLDVNPTFAKIVGLPRKQIIGKRFKELAPNPSSQWFDAFARVALTGETAYTEFYSESFQRYFKTVAARPLEGLFAVLVEDITERKRAEEALTRRTAQVEAANKELESFSYSVSHDLRAPLRAIDGYSKMILKKQGDKFDQDTTRQFGLIRDNTKAMGTLIDDLLAFSRVGRAALSLTAVDVEALVKLAWEELREDNVDRSMTLEIGHLLPATADRALLKQVIVNLLSNAIKFTRQRESALIEVGGYEKENEIVYYVKDNGVGFDMKYQDKMFGVFQRLHSADEYEGTGIGLAIVQRIVHHHGGRVWAEGKIDEGAAFYFTLPGNDGHQD